jgi:uncharacterized membrane protein YdbT with pleckstrin-like domain
MDPQQDDQLQKIDSPLAVMSPGETVVCHISRHPFGLFGVYTVTAFLVILIFVGVGLLSHYVTSLTTQDKGFIFAGAIAFMLIAFLYLYIAVTIYKGNRWIVTSDSITQITQTGLFQKQSSQLSLENLEDVTFEQKSMLQSMMGFGTLRVETAGEHSKFVFPYCPNPGSFARQIIRAHENFMAAHAQERSAIAQPTQVPNPQPVAAQPYVEPPAADQPLPPPSPLQ